MKDKQTLYCEQVFALLPIGFYVFVKCLKI